MAIEPTDPDRRRSAFRDVRILLADDNPFNREFFQVVMAGRGLDITSVANGAEALGALAGGGFDLAFMDVQMPVMDGLAATRAARAQGIELPIIALTANIVPGEIEDCLACGMNAHLSKPYTVDAALEMIAEWTR